ncbi:Cysteine-rich receptor-like protein kinase 8 [Camellia lanceoleosa]|uniref:Cysteine-rich receptor-like protein kinase 8 n=1 Tax=Camellia lanceoleosa TaxID=1840588 RepID=A0ACC0GIG9_9ERIC|nr:Cysteine-rich receptor-like protein kinase 8 [Camellia lanceoleosa]
MQEREESHRKYLSPSLFQLGPLYCLSFIIGFCFIFRRGKKKHDAVESDIVGNEITSVQSLQFDLATIQVAINFSDNNKIGQGGMKLHQFYFVGLFCSAEDCYADAWAAILLCLDCSAVD